MRPSKQEYHRQYYLKNIEKFKEYRKTHKPTKEYSAFTAANWVMNNPTKAILRNARTTAKRFGYEFNLLEEDIIIPEYCPYLGIKLTNIRGKGIVPSNISIDRIDPSKGYIKGNIQIISRKANTIKNDASRDELLQFAYNVIKLHGDLK